MSGGFLLPIVALSAIAPIDEYRAVFEDFPAYSSVLLRLARVDNLRTVIVTAAVYRGFDSRREPLLLTFRHRAGVRPYTSSFDLA